MHEVLTLAPLLRASSKELLLDGDLVYGARSLSQKAIFKGSRIPQLVPGQVFPLFNVDTDLFDGPKNEDPKAGVRHCGVVQRATGWNESTAPLFEEQDSREAQYKTAFAFRLETYAKLELPPLEYSG